MTMSTVAHPTLDKPALTTTPLMSEINHRWSPRSFKHDAITGNHLESILEAGRWAPSCFNGQPWFFIVGDRNRSHETYDAILDLLVPFNQEWAKTAPLLILSFSALHFSYNNQPNRHAHYDTGAAVENMVLQAMHHGIYSHQMAGFDDKKAPDVFGVPAGDYEAMSVIAFGYPDTADSLSTDLKNKENEARQRKPLSEFVFSRHWRGNFEIHQAIDEDNKLN